MIEELQTQLDDAVASIDSWSLCKGSAQPEDVINRNAIIADLSIKAAKLRYIIGCVNACRGRNIKEIKSVIDAHMVNSYNLDSDDEIIAVPDTCSNSTL